MSGTASTIYEIPLSAQPQTFHIALNGTDYQFTLIYRDAAEAGWTLDIADTNGNPLIAGIPLVTGADLLEQYAYVGIGVQLRVVSDVDPMAVPTFAALGTTSHLYFKVNS